MNPRLFCREYRFPRALALTYSFNPLFFERIILPDLCHGGSTDITVVGDQKELQETVERYAGQFNYLGNTYLLTPADSGGIFHPKMVLRIGSKGARLMLGSGNLTSGGWGGNRELAHQLQLEAGQPGSAATINHILDHVTPYLSSEVGINALDRLRDYPWLDFADEVAPSILMTKPEEPLAAQLQRRWAGRRFNRMVVLTGSTDEKGAFITWCHEQFGVEECVVAVSPENASFVKSDIERCPVKVSLAPFNGSQMLHAKFYWFDGPDGAAAIVGSANCSRVAWLLSPMQGGNVETIQIYDSVSEDDFAAILSAIPEARTSVERMRHTDSETEQKSIPDYLIKAIHLYRSQGFIDVSLNKPLPENAVTRLIGPSGIDIVLVPGENGLLTAQVNGSILWPETTCLAKIVIIDGDSIIETPLHWLDDMDAITRAAQIKPPAEPFKNLPRSSTSSEHEKVISDLAMISASIFSESAAYRDPPRRRDVDQAGQTGQPVEPVRPEDLIKSLNDLDMKPGDLVRETGGVYLSMNGVMRALFEEVETKPITENEATTSNPDDPDAIATSPKGKSPLHTPPRELPADRHKQRLKDELNKFFEKFSAEDFNNNCTASKLVQAASYPLAVALLGKRGSWLSQEESRAIVTRVVDILLNRNRVGHCEKGLLEEVQNHYKKKGQEDIFLQVIGDGTLWVVLLAVMAQLSWDETFERFERAINLQRIYDCDLMRADTSVGKLTALVTRLDIDRARELIAKEAPRIAIAIESLVAILKAKKEALLSEQAAQEHQVGDIIWRHEAGWGVVKGVASANMMEAYLHLRGENVKVAKNNFFVNLRMAAERYADIRDYLSEVGVAW